MAEGQSADKAPEGDGKPDEPAGGKAEEEAEETSGDSSTEVSESAGNEDEAEAGAAEPDGKADDEPDEKDGKADEPDDEPAEKAPAAAAAPAGDGSGGSNKVVPLAIAAVVVLVLVVAAVLVIGSGGDDDGDTETTAGDESDDHDHDDMDDHDHDDMDDHDHHDMDMDMDDVDFSFLGEEAEENGLIELLQDHHWHGFTDLDALSDEEQELLEYQIEVLNEYGEQYPTIADAEADDFRRAGPYIPGLGTHYISRDLDLRWIIPSEVGNPDDGMEVRMLLIYDGLDDDASLAGFMPMQDRDDDDDNPVGFAGADGAWHGHTNICVVIGDGENGEEGDIDLPFVGDQTDVTDEMCEDLGGTLSGQSANMLHVWSVEGWENEDLGLFAEVNPLLTCEDGTYHRMSYTELEYPWTTTCADEY